MRSASGSAAIDSCDERRPIRAPVGMPSRVAASWASTLSPIMRICSGVGPMKAKPLLLDHRGEIGVLGEKAEAGMDCLGAGDSSPPTGWREC